MWRPLWASGSLAGRRQAGGPAWDADWFVQPGACDPHPPAHADLCAAAEELGNVPGMSATRPGPDNARGTCREAWRAP